MEEAIDNKKRTKLPMHQARNKLASPIIISANGFPFGIKITLKKEGRKYIVYTIILLNR